MNMTNLLQDMDWSKKKNDSKKMKELCFCKALATVQN